jgi:hypothetical protein
MLTAVFAAISTFQQILIGENDIAFFRVIKVLLI